MATVEKRPLTANESYTQPGRDRFEGNEPIGGIRGLVYASHAGTLYMEESDDEGANWSASATLAVSAATTTPLPWTALTKQMYRFRYVNGATAQTKFRLVQQTRGMELEDVQLTGSTLAEAPQTEADAVGGVLTFNENIVYIQIYNTDATNAGIFTVNGFSIPVPAGELFDITKIGGTLGKTVTVSGLTASYIVSRYE